MKFFNKKNNNSLFFIIFLTSFLLGIIFSFYIGKQVNKTLLKTESETTILETLKGEKDLDLRKFWEVYSYIKDESYDSDLIKKQDLIDGAIKGMVDGIGDKHTEYLTISQTEKFNNALSGDFEGIGAVVNKNPLGIEIDRVISGSPAKKYGLKKGDIVITANSVVLQDLDLFDAIDQIKGPAGTSVDLEILRAEEKEMLEITVIRDKIKIPSVEFEIIEEGNLGYISINMFGEETSKDFRKALLELSDTNGLIINLRDNGGGYLGSAVEILSELIEEGKTIVTTKHKKSFFNQKYKSFNNGDIYNKKIVVLINENSASASEITAGALREYNKAILVGKKTYGKGSVQKPFELQDGSLLKLTIAKWFTPMDKNIDKQGIDPDIEISFEKEDYENNYDRQLEEAKKILQDFIKLESLQLTVDRYNKEKNK